MWCVYVVGERVGERDERRVKDLIGDWREFLRIEVVKTFNYLNSIDFKNFNESFS